MTVMHSESEEYWETQWYPSMLMVWLSLALAASAITVPTHVSIMIVQQTFIT